MGKVAIVTGAAGGIGAACAERFASMGYDIVIADLESKKEKVEKELAFIRDEYGVKTLPVYGDLASFEGNKKVVEATVEALGKDIAICMNNIGSISNQPLIEVAPEKYERVIQVDLLSVFHMCKLVLPYMIDAGKGCIINTASVYGMMGVPNMIDYNAAKAGVLGFTRGLAMEMAPHQIRVNAIAPGAINTELMREFAESNPEGVEMLRQQTPLGRIGEPKEIADAAEFLVKDEFMTGQVISPNGGMLMFS